MDLTQEQAYRAMFIFVRTYYYRIGNVSAEIGELLGDIQLSEDGTPADSAMWQDWLTAVAKVVNPNSDEISPAHNEV
jgi:hypothetical protein